MRIVVLETAGGRRAGVLDGDLVVDVNRAMQLALAPLEQADSDVRARAARALPHRLEALLGLDGAARAAALDAALAAVAGAQSRHGPQWLRAWGVAVPAGEAALAAPVAETATLYGIALNYRSHAEEAKLPVTDYPTIFIKPANTLRGPDATVPLPAASRRVDYEGEVAVVIGRRCRSAPPDEAAAAIAGYTLANDLSARDWQFRTPEMTIGKAFDGFCPMGPWLATPDECPDPAGWELATEVNGELRQRASLDDLIFGFAELVSYLSQAVTLRPGDAILTGTPAGIGATRNPRSWLRAGDVVEVRATGLGTLRTSFGQEAAGPAGAVGPAESAGAAESVGAAEASEANGAAESDRATRAAESGGASGAVGVVGSAEPGGATGSAEAGEASEPGRPAGPAAARGSG